MLTWKNKSQTPAGGWRYTQKESGMLITGPSWIELVNAVFRHRKANGYPTGLEIEREVEIQMCQSSPNQCEETTPRKGRSKTMADVLRFTVLLGEDIINGRERVPTEEADRRADICARCPDNIDPEGCNGCNSKNIENIVGKLVPHEKTKMDELLRSCRHCGCFNKAQIWFPLDMLQRHVAASENAALPSHCWKKKISNATD